MAVNSKPKQPRENLEGIAKVEEGSNWRGNKNKKKRMRRKAQRPWNKGKREGNVRTQKSTRASKGQEAAKGRNERVMKE